MTKVVSPSTPAASLRNRIRELRHPGVPGRPPGCRQAYAQRTGYSSEAHRENQEVQQRPQPLRVTPEAKVRLGVRNPICGPSVTADRTASQALRICVGRTMGIRLESRGADATDLGL